MEKGDYNSVTRFCMRLAEHKAKTDKRTVDQIYDRLVKDMMKLVTVLGEERTFKHLKKIYPDIEQS